jgi:hypothetical protein
MATGDDDELTLSYPVELSQRELIFIGLIVAQWGSLEHEIFVQTLMCFENHEPEQLPSAMNNLQFTQVLDLWEQHVVENAAVERREVLRRQLSKIKHFAECRNALVHGMWDWSVTEPEEITAVRIRKKQILSTHFSADDLQYFSESLGVINFRIRYPMGIDDLAVAAERGAYMSRSAVALFSGHPIADELVPSWSSHLRSGKAK